jgi:uncharacterized lipoprotein YddW (UPF0748 family)
VSCLIATVLSTGQQPMQIRLRSKKKDFIAILDAYKKLNYVVVQIRSAGDAMYPTNLALSSKYLTGKH